MSLLFVLLIAAFAACYKIVDIFKPSPPPIRDIGKFSDAAIGKSGREVTRLLWSGKF